ncbi:MAG: acyl-CoA thioesterase [Fimbriimonadaceae bacterium]|nr:acyl-CoA thioesterase [Fimbriimonadaceae bacterium]QYK55652.1 MAG: acyl-CoA thioesterase [Fimbriimonadaceae bacterium]
MSEAPLAKRVAETHTTLAQIMTPTDANILGKVFGGSVLSLIDLTASATAQKFAGRVCVTAAFDRVDFHEPIEVGELVTLKGHVSFAGRTSVEVTIDIWATDLRSGQTRHTNTARVTMVAIEDGRPVPVPKLICETREEKAAFLLGRLRRGYRDRRRQEHEEMTGRLDTASDAELDAMLAEGL